jgi:hypothetical protein
MILLVRIYVPLFFGNTDILLHDIDGAPLDPQGYGVWRDLSLCPAARYESRHRPRIKKGRVELFVRTMRISDKNLKGAGLRPRLDFSKESREAATAFFARHALNDRQPVIAIHAFSCDTYKDYPRMGALIEKLAERYKGTR